MSSLGLVIVYGIDHRLPFFPFDDISVIAVALSTRAHSPILMNTLFLFGRETVLSTKPGYRIKDTHIIYNIYYTILLLKDMRTREGGRAGDIGTMRGSP